MHPLEIIVKGDTSQANAALKKTQEEVLKTGVAVKKTEQSFDGLRDGANKIASTLHSSIIEASGEAGEKVKELGESFKEGGIKAIGLGLAAVAASYIFSKAVDVIVKDFTEVDNSIEKQAKTIEQYKKIVDGVTESVGKETTQTIGLLAVLSNETETRKRKLDAIKELQKIEPEIFKGLKLEGEAVIGLDAAYKAYLVNLRSVIAAKIIQAQIEAKITELLKIQGAANTKEQQKQLDNLKSLIAGSQTLSEVKKNLQDTKLGGGFLTDKQESTRVRELTEDIKGLFEKLKEFSKTIKVKKIKVKPEKTEVEKPDKLPKLSDVSKDLTQLSRASGSTLTPTINVEPKLQVNITDKEQKKILDAFDKFILNEKLKEAINASISTLINDTISSTADAVADALSGGQNVVPRLFDNIIKGIGQQIKELGKFMVKIGVEKLAIDKAIKALGLNPAATIAVGFAAQILGSLLISAASKKSNNLGQGFATGTRNSPGGTFLVGERGPERIFLPAGSAVQPNNELTAYGGGGQVFIPSVTLAGTDLVIAFNRASQAMNRNN